MTATETCAGRCGRPIVRVRRQVTPDLVEHGGRGMCVRCYRSWYHAQIRTFADPHTPDEIAIERALLGDPPAKLRTAERLEVVAILTRRGYSAAQIAPRAVCTPRTVQRHRARLGRAA